MKKLLLLFLLIILYASNLSAQSEDKQWNIGLHGGLSTYSGDIGLGFYDFDQAMYGFGGVTLSRYLGKHFDIFIMGTMGEVGHIEKPDAVNSFRASMTTGSLNLKWKILNPEFTVNPYIYVGGGVLVFPEEYSVTESTTEFALPFGGGLNFRLSGTINLQIQESFFYSQSDEIDGVVNEDNDGFLLHTVGLTFNMGRAKDADQDGVSDKKDKCPETPSGVLVDKVGCPIDTDKDGVADYVDDCISTPGLKELKGCPDRDTDGIADKYDSCPDDKGLPALNGCPDMDADGIADRLDQCPGTKAGYRVDPQGCPLDNDRDGVVNEEDSCMDVAGIIALKGCPDTDGDGVADHVDLCPTKPGTLANKGCPEIAPEDIKKISSIASAIYFETGSAKLKKTSNAQLNSLVTIMEKYEAAQLTIEGHTDSQGEDTFNMNLSQKRVDSVKEYLRSKGVLESRMTATGFGETKPVADNKTSSGRAKNRRVELKVEY